MPKKKPFLRWAKAPLGFHLKSDEKLLAHIWEYAEVWYGIWLGGGHQQKFSSKEEAQKYFDAQAARM